MWTQTPLGAPDGRVARAAWPTADRAGPSDRWRRPRRRGRRPACRAADAPGPPARRGRGSRGSPSRSRATTGVGRHAFDPRGRTVAEQDGDRHVGRLAGRRGDAVVEVEVAVDVDETDGTERIARARERPGEERAASAEEERALAVADEVGDGRRTRSVVDSTPSRPTRPVAGSRVWSGMRTSRSPASRQPARAMPSERSAPGESSVPWSSSRPSPTESIGMPRIVKGAVIGRS